MYARSRRSAVRVGMHARRGGWIYSTSCACARVQCCTTRSTRTCVYAAAVRARVFVQRAHLCEQRICARACAPHMVVCASASKLASSQLRRPLWSSCKRTIKTLASTPKPSNHTKKWRKPWIDKSARARACSRLLVAQHVPHAIAC
eukprot:1233895-Pleurochrysis_carterae.AAC.7